MLAYNSGQLTAHPRFYLNLILDSPKPLLFLLPENEQVSVIKRISDIVVPGGKFLFTAPIQIGTWRDITTGIESLSLGQQRYTEILKDAGFQIINTYYDKGKNNHYDTEKLR